MTPIEHDDIQTLRAAPRSQYHASLARLRQAIELCPRDLWVSDEHVNPTWRIACHALFYTHLYVQPDPSSFTAWEQHQTDIQHMDDVPAPADIEDLIERPNRPTRTGAAYTKEQVLEYWDLCDGMIDDAVDVLDLRSSESGFSWYPLPKVEHQLDRLRAVAGLGIDWVSSASVRAEH